MKGKGDGQGAEPWRARLPSPLASGEGLGLAAGMRVGGDFTAHIGAGESGFGIRAFARGEASDVVVTSGEAATGLEAAEEGIGFDGLEGDLDADILHVLLEHGEDVL